MGKDIAAATMAQRLGTGQARQALFVGMGLGRTLDVATLPWPASMVLLLEGCASVMRAGQG